MSFKPSYTLNKTNNLIELLKKEAQKKLNIKNTNENLKEMKSSSGYFSSDKEEYESESYEDDENTNSDKNLYLITNAKKINDKNKKENINKEYYRVNRLDKIKFMIFDFEQEMVIEKGDPKENKSEIENILINYKLKKSIFTDKDGNDPSIKIEKLLSKYLNNDKQNDKIIRINSIKQNQNTQKLQKKKIIFKKIESELKKQEKEKSIVIYTIVCFFFNIILLAMGGFSLYIILSRLTNFKGNINLILYAALIRHYINLGIYHTRMYTVAIANSSGLIYQNEDTINNRTKYLENLYNNIYSDFSTGSKYLEEVISINYKLNENNEMKLYHQKHNNIIIDDQNNIKNISLSYIVGISEIYSHFYYMITNLNNLKYNSVECINFIHNALNNGGISINEIINVYIDEIKYKKNNHIKLFYIIISIFFILLVIIYFIVSINYRYIISRRDTYLSIFFQINISFIKDSIIKCEKFLNRINRDDLIYNKNKNKDVSNNSATVSNFDNNSSKNEEYPKDIKNSNNQIKDKKNILKKKRNINLIIYFILFLLIVYLFLIIPLILFNEYISIFEIMGLYMYRMLHFHTNIIKIYNSYNEYLYYDKSTVENMPVLEFMEKTMNNTYDIFVSYISYLLENADKIPGLNEKLLQIQKDKLCNLDDLCDHYISTITSLGYFIVAFFFINEINTKINHINILYETKFKESWDNDIEKRMITLFNYIHYDLDYMFNHVILYYVEDELTATANKFFENINSENNHYIIIYTVFMILVILLFFFYWNPFIIDIQDQIYKAKLALKIIPMEILESQTNIKSLFGVSGINE